jgi:hypothetical protein
VKDPHLHRGLTISGSILDALRSGLSWARWKEPDDVVMPYGPGDIRGAHFETVWTFDLDNNQVMFDKYDGRGGRLDLSVLRQRPFTFDDFGIRDPPRAPDFDHSITFPAPHWKPILHVPQRKVTFIRRVFDDFNFQWRHVLRYGYNEVTFRKMAQAILWISTFKFDVRQLTEPRNVFGGALVDVLDIPEWEPLKTGIYLVGRVWFVASQDLTEGLSSVREHWEAKQAPSSNTYLIMSVRHIVLCRFNQGTLEWTCQAPFLNGKDTVSEQAVEFLLAATSNQPPLETPIHRLPIEVQSRVLRYMSQGPVKAACVGCVLELGLPFAWKDGKMDVKREGALRNRHKGVTPVESQLWFGDQFSGVSYKGDRHTITKVLEVVK